MKSIDRRSQLIKEATKLFSQNGFNGTTTKQIAAAAGVTEALIFRHFPSKEQLYTTVIDEYIAISRHPDWHSSIRLCMKKKDDLQLFRKLIEYVIEAYRCYPEMQRLILFATLEGYHREADRACHLPKPLLNEVIAYIQCRQNEGALFAMDPLGLFQTIFGMARSYAVGKYVYKLKESKMSDASAAEMFVEFARRSIILD